MKKVQNSNASAIVVLVATSVPAMVSTSAGGIARVAAGTGLECSSETSKETSSFRLELGFLLLQRVSLLSEAKLLFNERTLVLADHLALTLLLLKLCLLGLSLTIKVISTLTGTLHICGNLSLMILGGLGSTLICVPAAGSFVDVTGHITSQVVQITNVIVGIIGVKVSSLEGLLEAGKLAHNGVEGLLSILLAVL